MVEILLALACMGCYGRRLQMDSQSSQMDSTKFDALKPHGTKPGFFSESKHPGDLSRSVQSLSDFLLALSPTSLVANSHLARAQNHFAHRIARSTMSTSTVVPTAEVAKLFGRFAEKVLYLDKEVGACCHSACSDCEWRMPDGGYRFDVLRAARPKWIPCYISRDYLINDGGCHVPQWASALFPDGVDTATTISRKEFDSRIQSLLYTAPMGPSGTIRSDDTDIASESLDLLWAWLCGGEPSATELKAGAILQRLQDMSPEEGRDGSIGEGPDSIDWKGFAHALGVDPRERW
jgi:hypothetical protein